MATESQLPSITIIGLHEKNELHIIEGLLETTLPQPEHIDDTENYKWNIQNKYYDATVNLCRLTKNSFDSSHLETSEAVVVYFDNLKESALQDTDALVECLDLDFDNIEVKLLVCDCLSDKEALPKIKVQEWCIQHGWEAVELNLGEEDVQDAEDDFVDSWGFKRMKQALHAHTWSNLKLKEKEGVSKLSEECASNFKYLSLSDGESKNESSTDKFGDDDDMEYDDEFSALFSSLGKMKERAEALPPDQRKAYAEQIAFAFLKCLGDDDGGDSDD